MPVRQVTAGPQTVGDRGKVVLKRDSPAYPVEGFENGRKGNGPPVFCLISPV